MSDELHERWRQPCLPEAIEDDPTTVTYDTGRPTQGLKMRFSARNTERIRTGHVCLNCQEPFPAPFPQVCICGYQPALNQTRDFAEQFTGFERNPRAVKLEQGLDRVDDTHERNFYTLKNGIVVPKGAL